MHYRSLGSSCPRRRQAGRIGLIGEHGLLSPTVHTHRDIAVAVGAPSRARQHAGPPRIAAADRCSLGERNFRNFRIAVTLLCATLILFIDHRRCGLDFSTLINIDVASL
jgi:hypothetical protein